MNIAIFKDKRLHETLPFHSFQHATLTLCFCTVDKSENGILRKFCKNIIKFYFLQKKINRGFSKVWSCLDSNLPELPWPRRVYTSINREWLLNESYFFFRLIFASWRLRLLQFISVGLYSHKKKEKKKHLQSSLVKLNYFWWKMIITQIFCNCFW